MEIRGTEGLSPEQIQREVDRGACFVLFQYCVSVLILTFRRNTPIYFVRSGEGPVGESLPRTLLTLFVGWWGLPWGLIYTPMVLFQNMRGGKDVTAQLLLLPHLTQAGPSATPGVWPPAPNALSAKQHWEQ